MEKLRYYSYLIIVLLGGAALLYLGAKYIFPLALPFLLAWGVAFLTRPIAHRLTRGRARRVLRVIITLLFIGIVFSLFGVGLWRLVTELWHLAERLGEGDGLVAFFDGLSLDAWLPEGILGTDLGDKLKDAAYHLVTSVVGSLASSLSGFVTAVPRALLFIVITVIASVYFALELETVNSAVRAILPERAYTILIGLKNSFLSFGVSFVRSYLLLMLITFTVMLVGLSLLGSPYALLMSLIIAVLDLLPVIGVGTVIVPWSIAAFALGDRYLGVGLLILLAVHELVRQIAEPKILGKNIGIHPILTLMILYAGYALFGVGGILLVPLFAVLLQLALGKKNTSEVDKASTAERDGS